MKIKLIDVEENPSEELVGTCDLCFGTRDCDNPVFVFQLVGSNQEIRINGYWWDYDDYGEVPIPNIINFADWLDHQEFQKGTELNTDWLIRMADKYNSIYTYYRDVNGKLIKVGDKVKVVINFSNGATDEFVAKVKGEDFDYCVSTRHKNYYLDDLYYPQTNGYENKQSIAKATVEVI